MILHSRSLGEIQVKDEAVIYLPDGLLGFEDCKRFILAEIPEYSPFLWLVAVDDPEIGFAVSDPNLFYAPPFEVSLSQADKDILDLQPGDTVSIFVVVSITDGGRRITANLKGPVVLNARNRLGKQVVIYSPSYSVRQTPLGWVQEQVPVTTMAARGRAVARG